MTKRQIFARRVLRWFGWQIITPPEEPMKSVICVAPHTSNYDFFIGKLYYWAVGRRAGFLMKKEWFVFPFGFILRSMGGVPINRTRSNSTVAQLQSFFAQDGQRHIAITPEGTRKANSKWKTGFLRIAIGAQVPVQIGMIDYKKKEVGVVEIYHPTGDLSRDMQHISSHYSAEQARIPENFLPNEPREY